MTFWVNTAKSLNSQLKQKHLKALIKKLKKLRKQLNYKEKPIKFQKNQLNLRSHRKRIKSQKNSNLRKTNPSLTSKILKILLVEHKNLSFIKNWIKIKREAIK